jgi:hypothetical protein
MKTYHLWEEPKKCSSMDTKMPSLKSEYKMSKKCSKKHSLLQCEFTNLMLEQKNDYSQ